MKKLWIVGGVFLALGAVMLCLPLHMQPTGVVLLALGAAMALSAGLWRKPTKKRQTAIGTLTVLASGGVIILFAAMNLITCSGQSDWERAGTSDYAIVLGAAVQENGTPSRILRSRLTATLEFMEKNPSAQVILSGGQGSDEPEAEAQCMYDTLLEMGADASRLILETESHTTRENLQNSMAIIEERGGTTMPITLVTSEFHQRRAAFIAENLGLDTCPVSAETDRWFYRVNYTLREVFAFVKAFLQGGE